MKAIHSNPEGDFYTPHARVPKLVYLGLSLLVFGGGFWFVSEPLLALILGEVAEARVAEIRLDLPGEPTQSIKYRRPYKDDSNYQARYSHFISVPVDDRFELFRISVDSRRKPIEFYNVNDRVAVAYMPHGSSRLAFAYKDVRTWGIGGTFFALGSAMLFTAIPMLLAVGKPIRIDPEADDDEDSTTNT